MSKTYQPFIIDLANKIVDKIKNDTTFFIDEEIKSTEFAFEYVSELLTQKFISGDLSSEETEVGNIITEDDFYDILRMVTTQNALDGLVEKGLIDFIDDDGEKRYFLTVAGKNRNKLLDD